jgi:hypothetical protein
MTVAATARRGVVQMRGEAVDQYFRELDGLVLHLKGLVLVKKLRQREGADEGELGMYRAEIERVRERLAGLVMAQGARQPTSA